MAESYNPGKGMFQSAITRNWEAAKRDYIMGATLAEVAEKYGCDRDRVSQVLKAHGVRIRPSVSGRLGDMPGRLHTT